MLSNPLIAYATNYSLTINGDLAYGDMNGYLVSVYNDGAKKCAFISCCFADDTSDGKDGIKVFEFSKELSSLSDTVPALKNYEIEKSGITVSTTENLTLFDDGINALLELLEEFGVMGTANCSNCGAEMNGCNGYIVADNKACLLCGDCFAEGYNDCEDKQDAVKQKHTLKGTVFASIGALLSTAAIIASYIFLISVEKILGMSPLIICVPALALLTVITFLFYRLSTKAKGTERILPCLIVSTLFTSVTVYLSTSVLYAKEFGISSFANASAVSGILLGAPVSDPYYRADLLAYFFYSMVAVIVVVLLYSIFFEEKKKSPIKIIPYCTASENNAECEETSVNDEPETSEANLSAED